MCHAGIGIQLEKGNTAAVLRGAMALMLRSLASPNPSHNYCALCQSEQLRLAMHLPGTECM